MRVAHVVPVLDRLHRPGAELIQSWRTMTMVAQATALANKDISVFILAHRDEVVETGSIRFHFIRGAARLLNAVRRFKPDVVHLNGFHFPFQARALAEFGAPLLVQDHADAARTHPVFRWGYRKTAGAAFAAHEHAAALIDAGHLPKSARIFEIPSYTTTLAVDGDVGDFAGDPIIAWVGRLNPNKDPLTALDGIALAARELPELRAYFCFTESPQLVEVQARIAADPVLSRSVTLLGALGHDEVAALLRAADIFLLASHRESNGNALIEALACGATPVASNIPSVRAITGRGKVGLLFPPGDAEACAAAILGVATREKSRESARAHFESELAPAVLGRKLVSAYQQLI